MRKPPATPNRSSPTNVRPRATKHLYRPASAEHVVRHLGSPLSRAKPYFVFAGKEFFQQRATPSPLYQRGLVSSKKNFREISSSQSIRMVHVNQIILIFPKNLKSFH